MVAGIGNSDSYYYQQLAAGANSGSINFGQGQQEYNPFEENIWAVDGEDYSVGGLSGVNSSYQGGVNRVGASTGSENGGLVERLDAIDSKNIAPTYQDGEHKIDFNA